MSSVGTKLKKGSVRFSKFTVVGLSNAVVDVGIAGVIGGLVGAKLLWTAEHAGEEPLFQLLTSRGGMSCRTKRC